MGKLWSYELYSYLLAIIQWSKKFVPCMHLVAVIDNLKVFCIYQLFDAFQKCFPSGVFMERVLWYLKKLMRMFQSNVIMSKILTFFFNYKSHVILAMRIFILTHSKESSRILFKLFYKLLEVCIFSDQSIVSRSIELYDT